MAELSRLQNPTLAPFVCNVPVFASATGLLLRGCILNFITSNTGTGTYYGLTTAASTAQAKYALGPLNMSDAQAVGSKENNAMNASAFRFGTSNIPNRGAATGYNWMNAIINHDQLDYVTWDQTSANIIKQLNITASTGTAITITGAEASVAGAWIFSTDTATSITNTFTGSLRYISTISAATGTFGLTTAMNVSTDSDFVVMRPVSHKLTQLDSSGRFLMSTSAAGAGVALQIWENYIVHAQSPLTALRFWVHDGLNGLNVYSVRMMSEVMYLNHVSKTL